MEIIISPFDVISDTRKKIERAVLSNPNSEIHIINQDMGEDFKFNTGVHDMQHIIDTAVEPIEEFQTEYDTWLAENTPMIFEEEYEFKIA